MPEPIVCLDPGHGGRDSGAVGANGLLEKDINLAVCRLAAAELTRQGCRVVLTRASDTTITLEARAATANRAAATCFISVHCNSAGHAAACGPETYYHPSSRAGRELAAQLQRELVAAAYSSIQPAVPGMAQPPDRGSKPARYFVLRHTSMPAALVELGFLSHPAEAARLGELAYQARMAAALTRGTMQYLKGRC